MPTGSHRSPERIELADLLRRAVLAAHAEAELFRRNPQGSGRYAGRLAGRAPVPGRGLALGETESNGVKWLRRLVLLCPYDGGEGDKPQTAAIPVPVQAPVMTAGTGRAGKPAAPGLARAVISSGRRH